MSNDTLIFYAMQLKKHCRDLGTCRDCPFKGKEHDECILDDLPELWEINEENMSEQERWKKGL
jgi:hypothetical protein